MSINPPNNIVAQHKMCQNVQKLTVNRNKQLNFCILFQVPINLTICKCLDTLLAQFTYIVHTELIYARFKNNQEKYNENTHKILFKNFKFIHISRGSPAGDLSRFKI